MNKFKIVALIILLCLPIRVMAQKIDWNIDNMGFFDNREYQSRYQISQTYFGNRLSPEFGVEFHERHRLMVGANWVYSFGETLKETDVSPTIYYRFVSPLVNFSFGSFPRTQLHAQLPASVDDEILDYTKPNINGFLFQYKLKTGFVEAFLDWKGAQTEQRREAFRAVTMGRINLRESIVGFGWNGMMNHFARPKNSPDSISVMDDLVFNPYVNLNLTGRTALDSLNIKLGYYTSFERHRGTGKSFKPKGFLAEIDAEWRYLGIRNTFYAGKNQLPFFIAYGNELYWGDPFYQGRVYNRSDLYCYLFKNDFIESFFSWNFHFSDKRVSSQQQLIVRLTINKRTMNSKSDKRKALLNFLLNK